MNQIENYEISLDKLTKRVEELRAKEKTLNTQQQALNKAFKEGKITEQQYQKAMAGLNKELSSVANSQKQLGKVIDQQKKSLVDYGKTIGGVGDALGKVGGLGVGGFGAIGNAIKSLVAGPMGALTLAITAIATAWDHFKSKWEKDVEEQGSKLQTQLEQMAAYSEKNLNSQLDLLHKQNEMRKANLKTEVERVKYQQERDEAEIKKMNEIAEKLKKQYGIKVDIKDIEEKIAYYQNLADNEKSSAMAKKQYIREVAHLKEIQTYYTKITALQKDQRTKDMELQLAQQMDAEEARKKAEKEEEERIKKAKEDAKRLAEERIKANEEAIKQLEDLRIKCISNETDRQKAQIELSTKRAIEALEKIYAKAGAEGKKAAKEAIKMLEQIKVNDLFNIDVKTNANNFKNLGVQITEVMRKVLVENEEKYAIDPTAFIKTYIDSDGEKRIQTFSARLGQMGKEAMEEVMKDVGWVDRMCQNGHITDEQAKQMYEAGEAAGEYLTNGYLNVLRMSDEEVAKAFNSLNNSEFGDPKVYKSYLDGITDSITELTKVFPSLYYSMEATAQHIKGELTKIQEAEAQAQYEQARLYKEKAQLEQDEIKRFSDMEKQIKALHVAEVDRLNSIFADLDKQINYLTEDLKRNAISLEEFNEAMSEIENSDAYKDYASSIEESQRATEDRLAQLKLTHAESMLNIDQNYENQRTIITQEAAERRRQIMADEFNNASQFVGGMSDMFSALGDLQMSIANDETKSDAERDKARRKALNLQIAQTFMSMASGLAQGIASATEAGWPMMLLSIPSTVAMLIAQFAQVKQIMSQKNSGSYADGGEVKGKGSGTSDSIDARLSNGEYVVRNEVAQNNLPLLNSLNFGGGNNNFIEQLATAMAMQPAPQVAVQTIERVQTDLRQTEVYSHM